jgi:hypothetical protein
LGIYRELTSPLPDLTTEVIIDRIIENRRLYEARNKRKQEKVCWLSFSKVFAHLTALGCSGSKNENQRLTKTHKFIE